MLQSDRQKVETPANQADTTFAVEVKNSDIEEVVISNDNMDNGTSEQLDEIKSKSSVFIELNVQDGFAVSYNELPVDVNVLTTTANR